MKEFLRKTYYVTLRFLPKKLVVNMENFFAYKKFVSKKHPKYFGEKIQWLKLYGNLEQYNDYVDKYLVRNYVEKKIGKEHLIPLLGVYDKAEEIDYKKLPNQFVLKLNNGSGCNLIVKDKSKLNITKTNKKLSKWLKLDYSKIKKETQYKNVKRKLICEKYMSDKEGKLLDFKYFCFNGKPEFVAVDFERFSGHKSNFYNMKWEKLDFRNKAYPNYDGEFTIPKNADKMYRIAKKLCEDFQFARVDLYNVDGEIYFGELTFTPASGIHPFVPFEKDIEIAKRIEVPYE